MKNKIINKLPVLLIIFLTHAACSDEGDIIQDGNQCYLEGAGGVEKAIPCPVIDLKSSALTEEQKASSISSLRNFEASSLAQQSKKAARERKIKSRSSYAESFSSEIKAKAAQIKDDKYIVQITFFNDEKHPVKSSRHGYYSTGDNGIEFHNDSYAQRWDEIISSQLLGSDYVMYQPSVNAVSKDYVSMILLLEDSSQLESILQERAIKSIHHAGMPPLILEEIGPSSSFK